VGSVLEYLPLFLSGLAITLQLAVAALVVALVLGTAVAVLRVSTWRILRTLGAIYVEYLRNIPLLVHMFFWVFGLPFVGIVLTEFTGALIGLALYTSAFVAEAVRAGILAVGRGQLEAAASLGMSSGQTMRFVVLPQAIATTLPPLANLAIALTKNTSVASAVLVPELMYQAEVVDGRTAQTYAVFILAGAIYVALTLPMGRLVGMLETRLNRYRRA
jgi:aspartate/glutamate/glutamine transport system permease protein